MKEEIRHEIISETDFWMIGKTYHNNTYFGEWCKYKKGGNPPTPEQLKETERKRVEKAEAYRLANPTEPSKEYFEAIKKWPIIKKDGL